MIAFLPVIISDLHVGMYVVFELCHRFKKVKDTLRWEVSQGIEIRGRVFGFWPFGLSLSEYRLRPDLEVKGALTSNLRRPVYARVEP